MISTSLCRIIIWILVLRSTAVLWARLPNAPRTTCALMLQVFATARSDCSCTAEHRQTYYTRRFPSCRHISFSGGFKKTARSLLLFPAAGSLAFRSSPRISKTCSQSFSVIVSCNAVSLSSRFADRPRAWRLVSLLEVAARFRESDTSLLLHSSN